MVVEWTFAHEMVGCGKVLSVEEGLLIYAGKRLPARLYKIKVTTSLVTSHLCEDRHD